MTVLAAAVDTWVDVCALVDLPVEQGVCALVGTEPVALVRTYDGQVHAIGNVDPASGASVMSRGIVGCRRSRPALASPMYKQVYDLTTGECFDDPSLRLAVHAVRVIDGRVANLLKGVFGTFRNPTAHAPRERWPVSEADALDLFSTLSYLHRRLDNRR